MLDVGHMTKNNIAPNEVNINYFLPHHTIIKESSNMIRLRPIFNASAKNVEGHSLNNHLMVEANLLPDLVLTISRWRCY